MAVEDAEGEVGGCVGFSAPSSGREHGEDEWNSDGREVEDGGGDEGGVRFSWDCL